MDKKEQSFLKEKFEILCVDIAHYRRWCLISALPLFGWARVSDWLPKKIETGESSNFIVEKSDHHYINEVMK